MNPIINDRTELAGYVTSVLDGHLEFHVAGIVTELAEHVTYGSTSHADLEAVDFWAIAERHALPAAHAAEGAWGDLVRELGGALAQAERITLAMAGNPADLAVSTELDGMDQRLRMIAAGAMARARTDTYRRLREDCGWTVAQIADEMDVSGAAIYAALKRGR